MIDSFEARGKARLLRDDLEAAWVSDFLDTDMLLRPADDDEGVIFRASGEKLLVTWARLSAKEPVFEESSQALRGNPTDVNAVRALLGGRATLDWQDGMRRLRIDIPSRAGGLVFLRDQPLQRHAI